MVRAFDLPIDNLTGQLAVVSAANDGIGFVIASRLAQAVMPERDPFKGTVAADRTLDNARRLWIDSERLTGVRSPSVAPTRRQSLVPAPPDRSPTPPRSFSRPGGLCDVR
jgi:hypothetical protein